MVTDTSNELLQLSRSNEKTVHAATEAMMQYTAPEITNETTTTTNRKGVIWRYQKIRTYEIDELTWVAPTK